MSSNQPEQSRPAHASPSRFSPVAIGLYLNAVLLGAILLHLVTRNDGLPSVLPAAYAQQQPQPIAGGAGLFLMPAQFSGTTWGCYVMDVDRQVLMAYLYQPGNKTLVLQAARNFSYDRRLGNFNTDPKPQDVRAWGDKEADAARVQPPQNPPPVNPEAPARPQ
jgi:hypothetical protein